MAQDSAKLVKLPRRTALKQTTLSESVYAEIRSRLQRGEIGPNDRVLDYEVAEEFDCTRMPVRQAPLRLVSEGYLIGTTRGFVTPTLTNDDIHEIFEVRRLLEPAARAPSPSWTIARTPRSSAPSRRQSRPTTARRGPDDRGQHGVPRRLAGRRAERAPAGHHPPLHRPRAAGAAGHAERPARRRSWSTARVRCSKVSWNAIRARSRRPCWRSSSTRSSSISRCWADTTERVRGAPAGRRMRPPQAGGR